jgi:hypothetical protein
METPADARMEATSEVPDRCMPATTTGAEVMVGGSYLTPYA